MSKIGLPVGLPVGFPVGLPVSIVLPALSPGEGVRKLYVDRERAARLEPPIVVEDPDGARRYARRVSGLRAWDGGGFEFKWAGDNTTAPQLWIETDVDLELTL